jgi:hypothetical protein
MTLDSSHVALAMASVLDAALSAVDPTGAALHRACRSLRDGLRIAEQMGVDNAAAEIVREVVASIEEVETQEKVIG